MLSIFISPFINSILVNPLIFDNELLDANTEIQSATTEVSDHTTQAVTAIEELSVTSKNIAVNTAESATASDGMMTLAHSGLDASEQTKDAVTPMPGMIYSFYMYIVLYSILTMAVTWLMMRQIKSLNNSNLT